REVHWALGPAETSSNALDCHGAGEGRESVGAERGLGRLLGRLEVGIGIAPAGQRSQGQRLGRVEGNAGLAVRPYGLRRGRFQGRGRRGSCRCRHECASVHRYLLARLRIWLTLIRTPNGYGNGFTRKECRSDLEIVARRALSDTVSAGQCQRRHFRTARVSLSSGPSLPVRLPRAA